MIEAAGLTTISLSNIPDLTASVGVPRLVAIEHPFGRLMGNPGNSQRQMAVLRDTLEALRRMGSPGETWHLPYKWEEAPGGDDGQPSVIPPIAKHIISHPWQLPRLLKRNPPE